MFRSFKMILTMEIHLLLVGAITSTNTQAIEMISILPTDMGSGKLGITDLQKDNNNNEQGDKPMPSIMNPDTTYVEHIHRWEETNEAVDKQTWKEEDSIQPEFPEGIRYECKKGNPHLSLASLKDELTAISTLQDNGYSFGLETFTLQTGETLEDNLDFIKDFLVSRKPNNQTLKLMVVRIG